MSPADLADLRRQTTNNKQQNSLNLKQIVFLCVIMQLAAFLCVICVICGRIHARVLNQSAKKKPQCLSQITLIIADETQNNINLTTCLSLRDNAACCIPLCVICVICGRITRKSTQTIHTEETPMSPADPADLRRRTTKQQNHINQTNGIPLRYLRENKRAN